MYLVNLFIIAVLVSAACSAPNSQTLSDAEAIERNIDFSKRKNRNGIEYFRCVQNGTIAITFDDGPSTARTGEVVSALRNLGVPAAFFLCGALYGSINDPASQRVVADTVNAGHKIGHHTWSHASLDQLNEAGMVLEMDRLSNILQLLLGRAPSVMRPPYGAYNNEVIRVVNGRLGYRLILWSFATNDFAHPGDTAAGVAEYQRALGGTNPAQTPGHIVLHHDPLDGSAALTTASVNYARSQGYRFVSLPECLGFDW